MDVNLQSTTIAHQLEAQGTVAVTINGMSMYPMLYNRRDVVVLEKYRGKASKYDVLLYKNSSGKLVLHRVIKNQKRGECFVIRGDNCNAKEYIPESSVLGVLTEFTRKNKDVGSSSVFYKVYSRVIVFINPLVCFKIFVKNGLYSLKKKDI